MGGGRGGYFFWSPYTKDYSIWGSILGSPYFAKLPYNPYITYSLIPYSKMDSGIRWTRRSQPWSASGVESTNWRKAWNALGFRVQGSGFGLRV